MKVENNKNILNKYLSFHIFDVPLFSDEFKYLISVENSVFFFLDDQPWLILFPLLILISARSNFPLFLKPGGKPLTCFSSWGWCVPPQLTLIRNLSSAQTCSIVVRVPPSRSYFKLTMGCLLRIVLDLWAAFQIIPMVYICVALVSSLKKELVFTDPQR